MSSAAVVIGTLCILFFKENKSDISCESSVKLTILDEKKKKKNRKKKQYIEYRLLRIQSYCSQLCVHNGFDSGSLLCVYSQNYRVWYK